ncbi:MAG: hypothetical protein KatS3mg057_2750 [Herpetosiphonaceae bacterium]|nr:MAG: hypothetical protein KatS3mg057_2750 [Herpetosiphonaceae bacterium]
MRILVIHDLAGRNDQVQAILDRMRDQLVDTIVVLGNLLAPDIDLRARPAAFSAVLEQLTAPGRPVYLIPGERDYPLEHLLQAVRAHRGKTSLVLVHRTAAPFGCSDVIAGFGGLLTKGAVSDGEHLAFAEWEVRAAFEHIANFNPLFQLARRRIFLFANPPRGNHIDREGEHHVGLESLNWLLRVHQPDVVFTGGPASGRGIEVIEGTLVVNPGSLAEGSYAIVDLDPLHAELKHLPEEQEEQRGPFRSIVVAIDGSTEAWHALELAAEMARQHAARLTLVHAFEPIRQPLGEPNLSAAIEERIAQGEQLLEQAAVLVADLLPERELLEGPADEAIIRVARSKQADLIVMGARGQGALRSLMGSISSRVLRSAPCPVLIASHAAVEYKEKEQFSQVESVRT